MIPRQVTALFVKAPIPGRVKTRLAKDIGNQAACTLYRRLASRTIEHAVSSAIPLAVCYDGNLEELPDDWKRSAWSLVPQTGCDLGQRMAAAFCRLFSDSVEQVVLIGSDIPGIDAAYLQQAFSLLEDHDLVIGPASDGGYCLIGFQNKTFTPVLFEEIPWSTDKVLQLTLEAAVRKRLNVALLPVLSDIDSVDDLRKAIRTAR